MPPTLETVLMRQLNLNYAGARNLVADARAELHMARNAPYTPELEQKCFKLFQEKFGPAQEESFETTDESMTVSEATSPAKSVESNVEDEAEVIDSPMKEKEEVVEEQTEEATETEAPHIEEEQAPVMEAKVVAAEPKKKRGFLKKIFSKKGKSAMKQ